MNEEIKITDNIVLSSTLCRMSFMPRSSVRLKKISLFVLFCVGIQAVFAQWNTSNMLQMGKNAMYFDDYISAIDNFNNIIRIKPYLPEPFFFRGLAKFNLDDYEGAIQDYTRAIEVNPNYFHAYVYRGIAYQRLKRYEEALKDYQDAIALDPRDAYVYANRGITEAEMGDYKAAEKDYSKALMIDNKLLPAYLNRAIVRERMDNAEGAMTDCNAAIKLNMFSDDAYGLRGYLWYKQKNYFNAIEDFNRALKANPENKRILMSRAMVWYDMKKYPETMADYTEAIRLDSTYIYAYYNRALLRAEVGEYNNAIKDLDKVLEMNPDNILVYFNRGLMKLQIRDLYGAYDDFSESIRLYPDFVKAYMLRATISAELRDYASADKDRYIGTEIMERYKKMKAGDRNALVDTASNFRRLVDINARNDELRDVVNGRVQDKNVIIELQRIFCVQYLSIDSLRNGKVQYYNEHIMNYNQEHHYSPAITISNKVMSYPKDFVSSYMAELSARIAKNGNVDDYLIRGSFYINQGEYPKAIQDFDAITAKEPDNLLALFNKAGARMLMYDYIESIDDKSNRVIGAQTEERRKVDYSQVLEEYNACLKIDPSFVFALFNMANVYVKNEDVDKAIVAYTQVISIDKDIAEAYFNRGLLYIYIGKKALANADLSRAGELGIVSAYNIIKRYCKEEN